MKIVCQSCGAKYSIADEKVAGKVFKIRCKKCSATIVVKGDQQDADAATRVYDYGGDAIWHAVVNGEQSGPFNPRQIGEMLAEGKIDWEAYVWREGMENWLPAKDVEDLVNAVMSEGGDAAEAQGEPSGAAPAPVFGGSSDMGADPFASDDGGLSSVMGAGNAAASAAPAAVAASGADLFAQSSRSPFAGVSADDEPAPAAAASPRAGDVAAVSPDGMTGQRNENSVLFSLSNLQALATGSGSGAAASSPRPGMAQGEGSGLIDIRALASATQAVADKPNGAAREKVEDLLAVGAASTAFSAASFAAPVAVEKADNSKLMLGAMGAAILVLGGAVAYLAMRDPAPAPVAGIVAPEPAAAAAAPANSAPPATSAAAALPTPADSKPEHTPEPAAAPAAHDEERHAKPEHTESSGSRPEKKKSGSAPSGGGSSKAAEKSEPAAAPEPPAPKKAATTSDTSIDDLLSGALGGKAKPAAKPAGGSSESLAATPSREDVMSAMKGVAPKVTSCAAGQTGVAQAKVIVTGSTGKVSNVDVSGVSGPATSCIAKAVGAAKFPKFSQASFSFTYPFKL